MAELGDLDYWRASVPDRVGGGGGGGGGDSSAADWYAGYRSLRPLLAGELLASPHEAAAAAATTANSISSVSGCHYGIAAKTVLIVGPGRSPLHECLSYDTAPCDSSGSGGGSGDGGCGGTAAETPLAVTVVDAAPALVSKWRARVAAPGAPPLPLGRTLKFEVADISVGLPPSIAHFHVAIDKGTVDCLLCRAATGERDARAAIANLHAALRPGGALVLVSHSPPAARLTLLKCAKWANVRVKLLRPPALADVAAAAAAGSGAEAARQQQQQQSYHQDDESLAATLLDVADGTAAAIEPPSFGCSYVYVCRRASAEV